MENVLSKKNLPKSPNWVGAFIRQKREDRSLSQKELGQMLEPPVTTQFISNLERGVTPVPAAHIQALVRALGIQEAELMALMEKEYAAKLTSKIAGQGGTMSSDAPSVVVVPKQDEEFYKWLLQNYNNLRDQDRDQFRQQVRNWFEINLRVEKSA